MVDPTEAVPALKAAEEVRTLHQTRLLRLLHQLYAAQLRPIRAVAAHRLLPLLLLADQGVLEVEEDDKYSNNPGVNYFFVLVY